MGLLLLKINDYNSIYEFNKRSILQVRIMKTKRKSKKAVIQPLKVVLVEQESTIITHIHRSRGSFRFDEKARYDEVIAKIIERPESHYGH